MMLKLHAQSILYVTPPTVTKDHIQEKIVCVRAHRERIFRVELEQLKDKVLFHNYGQGGAGWTFLFGCVHASLRQFDEYRTHHSHGTTTPIAVIGAGCYGLLTAIMLARKGYTVRIIAQEIDNLPSYKAAGFFFPRPRKCSTPQECALFTAFGMESYKTYLNIRAGTHPFIRTGAELLPAYFGLDIDPGFTPYISAGLMETPEKITIDFGNGKRYTVMNYTTIFMNAVQIMDELWQQVRALDIPIIQATISSFDDVQEAIIFNCAGLGAKQLTHDPRIVPVQGHLITLKNQPPREQIRYMLNVKVIMTDAEGKKRDELIYYAPKESGILGITFLRGQNSLTTNHHEFDRLLQRCQDFFGI